MLPSPSLSWLPSLPPSSAGLGGGGIVTFEVPAPRGDVVTSEVPAPGDVVTFGVPASWGVPICSLPSPSLG